MICFGWKEIITMCYNSDVFEHWTITELKALIRQQRSRIRSASTHRVKTCCIDPKILLYFWGLWKTENSLGYIMSNPTKYRIHPRSPSSSGARTGKWLVKHIKKYVNILKLKAVADRCWQVSKAINQHTQASKIHDLVQIVRLRDRRVPEGDRSLNNADCKSR